MSYTVKALGSRDDTESCDTPRRAIGLAKYLLEECDIEQVCITHPDGTKEYWRAEIKRKAVKCEPGYADWDDE